MAKTCIWADMGWLSDTSRRNIEMMRLWNRLVKLPENRRTHKVFKWSFIRNSAWCKDIQEVLSKCNMLDLYRNICTGKLSDVKDILLQAQQREIQTEVLFKPKLKVYREIKCEYNTAEPFVHQVNNRKSRSLITLLRARCLPIEVEVGRWQNVPRENRICKNMQ